LRNREKQSQCLHSSFNWNKLTNSKGGRFESCATSIFRYAYFLQPLFWRLYAVAVLVTR